MISIIGMAGVLPGAVSLNDFWENVSCGFDLIINNKNDDCNENKYIYSRGVVDIKEQLKFQSFGYSKKDDDIVDSQLPALLETVCNAIDDSGLELKKTGADVGVFISASSNLESLEKQCDKLLKEEVGSAQVRFLCDREFWAQYISYKLNLTGPSLAVHSACSSSLTALHFAIQSLRNGDCDYAIVAAASLNENPYKPYRYQEGGIYSKAGKCLPFTNVSDGTVPGNGVVALILSKSDVKKFNKCYANIISSVCNNDGSDKIGFTAPSYTGHKKAILKAFEQCDTRPEEIQYVEPHGTGTLIGDKVEFSVLNEIYGYKNDKTFLGTLKANIGHLDAAAGLAGIVKLALSLKHRTIPKTCQSVLDVAHHDVDNSQFKFSSERCHWAIDKGEIRKASISALGIGGTNVHMILQESDEVSNTSYKQEPTFSYTSTDKKYLDSCTAIINNVKNIDNIEEGVTNIWYEILGSSNIEDDFFDIGGSSLHAIQLIDRIQSEWGVEIDFEDFFERSSLADLIKTCIENK
ncbi:beta-ketoacyl synthase N-terminal-like domain-containing protein [Vibrio cyclitrophicus]